MARTENEELRAWDEDAEGLASLGQIAGELIHDLGNVVAVAHGFASLALDDAREGRLPTAELEQLVETSQEVGGMLRDVLETLRGSRLSPEVRFDPVKLVQHVVDRVAESAPTIRINLRGSLPCGTRVPGRASFLSRALLNLLTNAARHGHSEIRLTLTLLDEEPPVLSLLVEDDGPGISPALLPGAFRPLVQGETGGGILGLGLSSVRWAMQQLGGEVRYRDDTALGGAAFELRVPAVMQGGQQPRVQLDALAGRRLAVIEDDPAVQRVLVRLLRRMGAEAVAVNPRGTPEEVLQTVLRAMPEAILLDLRLGPRHGTEIWYALRNSAPSLARRVVFLSAVVPADPEWEAAKSTGQPMLAKPLDMDQLVTTLTELTLPTQR
jgi:CheY-like chemotaxis protein